VIDRPTDCACFCLCCLISLPLFVPISVCLPNSVYAWWIYECRQMLAGADSFWALCICLRLCSHLSHWRLQLSNLWVSLYTAISREPKTACRDLTRHACCQVVQAWTNHASLVRAVSLSRPSIRSLSAMRHCPPTHGVCV